MLPVWFEKLCFSFYGSSQSWYVKNSMLIQCSLLNFSQWNYDKVPGCNRIAKLFFCLQTVLDGWKDHLLSADASRHLVMGENVTLQTPVSTLAAPLVRVCGWHAKVIKITEENMSAGWRRCLGHVEAKKCSWWCCHPSLYLFTALLRSLSDA